MNPFSGQKLRMRWWGILVSTAILFALTACGGEAAPTSTPPLPGGQPGTAIPEASPTLIPTPDVALTPTHAPTPTPAPIKEKTTPGATPSPTLSEPPTPTPLAPGTPVPLNLELLAPQDGAGVETGALRVLGKTRVDAVVGINGVPAEVFADGSFTHDLLLEEGINLIEVVASDLNGATVAEQAIVFFIPFTAGLPFALFYPPDGLEVSETDVPVMGGTRPDAVVGVNGTLVAVNALGIFSTTVILDEGPNFIEVVATDIQGNMRSQTVAVFYLP